MRKSFIIAVLLLAGVAVGQVITPIIVTEQPAGTYSFPIAPVMNAGKSRSDLCYYHSEHTANTTGDSNIALCSGTHRWTLSPAGSTQHASIDVYYVELAAGGDPSITSPTTVSVDGVPWYSMTCGAMDPGSWCYGDVDTLGFNTIYVAMLNTSIPDPDDASYGNDAVTAVYGQGAKTKRYCASGAYNEGTGALTCTDNFLLYGWVTGDRILIQHADINSGTPTWTTVSSKTSKDAVVVAAGLAAGPIASGVKIYTHTDPYLDARFAWSFPDNIYSFTNTDDRPQAATTVIPTTTFVGPVAAPLLNTTCSGSTCATTGAARDDDYSLTIHDDVNGISSSASTGTYTDDAWTGAREIYIDATSGTDVANCLTGVQSGCTSGAPCQTWACGISQLVRTVGPAILYVDRGETYPVTADVTFVSGDTDQKWINGSGYGTGADPIVDCGSGGVDYLALDGTTTSLRMNDIKFVRSGGCSGACNDLVSVVLHKSLVYRCHFYVTDTGGALSLTDLDGTSLAWLDNIHEVDYSASGATYPMFAMGGDGLTAHSIRHRAFIGNKLLSSNQSHTISRVRAHESVFAYPHHEIVEDIPDYGGTLFRFAQDNHPHYQQYTLNPYLMRSDGCDGYTTHFYTIQSGGRSAWERIEGPFWGSHSGCSTNPAWSPGSITVDYVKVSNPVVLNHARAFWQGQGKFLDVNGLTFINEVTDDGFHPIEVTTTLGYENLWFLNSIVHMPNCLSSPNATRTLLHQGTSANIDHTHIHKVMINRGTVSTGFRVATTNYSPSGYETARSGMDIIGGAAAGDSDPQFVDAAIGGDICTGTDTPAVGCTLSPAIDAGFTDDGLYSSFDGTVRPAGAGYDIGAFEADTATGRCYECDGDCVDDVTESACTAIGGDFDEGEACAGDAPTGACCTAIEGNCSVITDACCAATWLTGDVCTDCTGKCCQSDGTCSVVSQTTCAAFTNEVFTWGGTCGTCPTVACCDGVSCSDVTEFACTALGFTSAGVGTDCGTGSPCAGPTSGSCCEINGTCMVTTEAACDLITDAIWTDAGVCDPNTCAPAWACCEDDGGCTNITDAACTAASGNWQDGVACFGNLCTIGACCDVDTACTETIQADCTADEWFIDSLCSDPTCDVGTCCECDNTCTDTISASCLAPGVIFTAGASCAVEDCTWTLGACCIGGVCGASTSACCTQFEGTYYGDGSSCGPTTCSSITKFLLLGVKQ